MVYLAIVFPQNDKEGLQQGNYLERSLVADCSITYKALHNAGKRRTKFNIISFPSVKLGTILCFFFLAILVFLLFEG